MASDPQFDIKVRGGGATQGGYVALPDLMDAIFGASYGLFPERSLTGWKGIQLPHFMVVPLVGVVATTGGAIAAATPKEGGPVIVTRATIVVQTISTGAATLDIGVGATKTTSADNLIDGCDVNAAAAVAFDNITDISTNGTTRQYMAAGSFVTVTGSADTTGFTGVLYLEFIKI